jgi:hypothetical protein
MVARATSPRTEEIEKLWRHLFGGERGLLQVWTAIRDERGELPRETIKAEFFAYPGAARSAAEYALDRSEEGREVYFCAHLLTDPKRVKENAASVHTLWGEFDGSAVPNGELKPTAVVESSPGKFHVYWRLNDAIPPKVAENLNRRLAAEIGADPSGFDLTQLLRVPGTTNHKYPAAPQVTLVGLEGGRSYSAADLDALLPRIEEPKAEYVPNEDADEPPVVLDPEAMRVWRGERAKLKDNGEVDRSASLMVMGRKLYDAGATRPTIVTALRERDEALGWEKYTSNRDGGRREYERIYEKLAQEGRNRRVSMIVGGGETQAPKPEGPPEMDEAAYRGAFGRIVEKVDPHTEGDPVAVLASIIVAFANAMGRGPYVQIGATKHRTNLFCGIVGDTAKGRKGSTWDPVENVMHAVDRQWTENRILSGLSSGEGLISEVRDPLAVPGKDGKMTTVDQGVKDKRLLVMEGELSQALKVMKREGNTLSPVMRNAWDGKSLRTMVKHSPHKATDPHISILGHITLDELVRHLTETEMANGLANRILWLLVRRSKSLPFGGEWHTVNLQPIAREIVGALEYGNREVRMTWGEDAKPLWCEAYEVLTEDRAGMFGAVTARAEAQTLRLAMIYALANTSQEIRRSHVESALAVWEYAEESARRIFGDRIGDPDADKLLKALEEAEDRSMTRNEVRELFGRNKGAEEIDRIRAVLLREGRIKVTRAREGEGKKPTERWYAA